MKEYMLLIINLGNAKMNFPPEKHTQFLKSCEMYIENLKKKGKLVSAQPLVTEGKVISGSKGMWKEVFVNQNKEIQVGYYHILAKDLEEAVSIAKANPEFEFTSTAKIEVRPIKMKEEATSYVYPTNADESK